MRRRIKVKFLSMIGSSFPHGLMTEGLPTRQASAVLFYYFSFVFPLREFSDDEEITELLRAEFSFELASSYPGLRALITRRDSVLPLLKGRLMRGRLRQSSILCSSSFKF